MSWPTLQEYQEALQNPAVNLSDSYLRQGAFKTNPLGLPMPSAGNFATVYQLVMPVGTRFAVRVFNYEQNERNQRYHLIGKHLRAVKLPYMVNFEFIEKGVLVLGHWYPILKMDWIEGEPLHKFIETNLSNPDVLHNLARDWLTLCRDLRKEKIAHGDLQHMNVMVSQGKLRLIDYDGMFVPGLELKESTEAGHRHYQHPLREDYFGPYLDHFSSFVIYASLLALAIDPGLWKVVQVQDECLLFRQSDYHNPDSSHMFDCMMNHSSDVVKALATRLKSFTQMRLDEIPPVHRCAPLPAQSAKSASGYELLALPAGASAVDIEAAREFFKDIWDPNRFRGRRRLMQMAEKKRLLVEQAAADLLAVGKP